MISVPILHLRLQETITIPETLEDLIIALQRNNMIKKKKIRSYGGSDCKKGRKNNDYW